MAADRVEDVTKDERVQNAVMANTKDVRRDRYQEKEPPAILELASEVRAQMRGTERLESPAPISHGMLEALRAAGLEVSPKQVDAICAALARSPDTRRGKAE